MYMAPELINFTGHDKGADHWSWAAMVYEMVTGHYAFYNSGIDEVTMYKRICRGEFKVNSDMSFELKLLFISMFVPDSSKRLGARTAGWQDIFKSPWFKDIDIKKLKKRDLTAPWVPKINNPLDSSNFEGVKGVEDKMNTEDPEISGEDQKIFSVFGPMTNMAEC
jgi:serine/threonine protein kinase